MSDLCVEFGISRKTGHKLWKRYQKEGPEGLYDRSRAPLRPHRRTPDEVRELVFEVKKAHPSWGANKVRAYLLRRHPGVKVPAGSTIHAWFEAKGLVKRRLRRSRVPPRTQPLAEATEPNRLWCADFKGQFRLKTGRYCYPLTITDAFSRKILACVGLENTKTPGSRLVFEETFVKWGLPEAIRTDNGAPFASRGLLGMSQLSAWWRRLGIEHERITPGKPQQNGSHERMHLTLKQECTRPVGDNILHQQEMFDRFVDVFNQERPHEALDNDVPDDRYRRSERELPEELPDLKYPTHDLVLRVDSYGHIDMPGRPKGARKVYISSILVGECIGVREMEGDRWRTDWMDLTLGDIDMTTRRLEDARE